jgi:hypothetical protein
VLWCAERFGDPVVFHSGLNQKLCLTISVDPLLKTVWNLDACDNALVDFIAVEEEKALRRDEAICTSVLAFKAN